MSTSMVEGSALEVAQRHLQDRLEELKKWVRANEIAPHQRAMHDAQMIEIKSAIKDIQRQLYGGEVEEPAALPAPEKKTKRRKKT